MAIDIYSTVYMANAMKEKPTLYTFMKDRYFGSDVTAFKTEKVIVDYTDGDGNVMAPFVIPKVGKVPMYRDGYETRELIPANIAPSRPLSIDDLTKRLAGESIVSTMTPAERERQFLMDDLDFLDKAITRREEWMCVNTMLDNACTMKHIGQDSAKGIDLVAQYYTGSNNPGVFSASTKWAAGTTAAAGTWYKAVAEQAYSLTDNGREVTDLVVGTEVGAMILSDPWVQKMLDNRRIEIGKIDPQWQKSGVVYVGNLNFDGIDLNIFIYRGTYQERTLKGVYSTQNYFPTKGALLSAPNTGKLLYGAVTQIEDDKNTYTRTGTRVPKHNVDVNHNERETILTSRPIAAPTMVAPWRACRNVLS